MTTSVLVSNHNYRDHVVEAIDSALAQAPAPLEVIVVDDGSTDGSGEMLQARYAGHAVVRVICTPNRGQLAAFVTALKASRGDVVAFLDADDRYRAGYLARINAAFEQNPSVAQVFCNMQSFGDETGLWLPILDDEDLGTAALRTWALQAYYGTPTSGITMRRKLCEDVLLELPESLYLGWRTRADDCLVFGAALLGAHRYYVGEALVDYRFHARNSWAGKYFVPVRVAQHRYHLTRTIDWYAQRAGLNRQSLRWAVLEFRTKPKPRPGDFLTYLWLQFSAPSPPRVLLSGLFQITVAYVLSLWKIKKVLRTLFPRRA